VLAALLDHVRDQWGGFDGYAREHVRLDDGFPERLRASLLA